VGSLRRLGLSKVADHVLVGLALSRDPGPDPVDEAIRRNALQRRAVELARLAHDVMAGKLGDHGVVFLSCASGSLERRKRRLSELADKVMRLARRDLGLAVYFGASVPVRPEPLNLTYRAALGAAESALQRAEGVVWADASASLPPLRQLRKELSHLIEQDPGSLTARFDRYLEAVAAHCAYRLDAARGHVEAGFERSAEPLVGVGALDPRSFSHLVETLDRAAAESQSLIDLFAAYRRAAADLADAVKRPGSAHQDRNLRVALDYIHQHCTEPLRLTDMARRAGFAPSHFSKLFIKREQVSFQHYLRRLRVERAKHLLANTDLALGRIAELTGFGNAAYFCRVFRQSSGGTPLSYRKRTISLRSSQNARSSRKSAKIRRQR
jgi:AraC-like DNA-binding protein